jgi:hypothetical protein
MRKILFAVTLVVFTAGTAVASFAADYLVVSTTDPSLAKGSSLKSGSSVNLAAGGTLLLVSASGQMVKLIGSANGARVPDGGGADNPALLSQMQTMLLRPPPSRRTFGAMRGPSCPELADLKTLGSIVAADQTPECQVRARQAMDAYIAAATDDQAPISMAPAKP